MENSEESIVHAPAPALPISTEIHPTQINLPSKFISFDDEMRCVLAAGGVYREEFKSVISGEEFRSFVESCASDVEVASMNIKFILHGISEVINDMDARQHFDKESNESVNHTMRVGSMIHLQVQTTCNMFQDAFRKYLEIVSVKYLYSTRAPEISISTLELIKYGRQREIALISCINIK